MARKIVDWSFIIFFVFSIYLFKSYEKINDELLRTNDSLLKVCMASKMTNSENERY